MKKHYFLFYFLKNEFSILMKTRKRVSIPRLYLRKHMPGNKEFELDPAEGTPQAHGAYFEKKCQCCGAGICQASKSNWNVPLVHLGGKMWRLCNPHILKKAHVQICTSCCKWNRKCEKWVDALRVGLKNACLYDKERRPLNIFTYDQLLENAKVPVAEVEDMDFVDGFQIASRKNK